VIDVYIEEDTDEDDIERLLTSEEYTLSAGKLILNSGLFQEGREYEIIINADGYSSNYFEGKAYPSTEIFYVTAPNVTLDNGITASINLFKNFAATNDDDYEYDFFMSRDSESNDTAGTQVVLFQLMNGTTPVSIVASQLKVDTGTYTANFNVIDADTANYTVKAFIVSSYDNSTGSVGVNLASVKTQREIDILIMNNDDNYYGEID
jgi:hypothetical protein